MKWWPFGRKAKERLRQIEKHEQEQDERIERVATEVQALASYVHKQPDLRAVNDH